MLKRVITGIIGGSLAIFLMFLPPIAITIAMTVVCVIGMYELLVTTKHVTHRGVLAAAIVFSATTPYYLMLPSKWYAVIIMFLYVAILVLMQVKYHDTLPVEHTGYTFMMSIIYSLALSCLAYLRQMPNHGLLYVFIGIVIPWMCDMGAYFVGTFFGKHKMSPNISPNKTVEGLIGGIIVSLGSTLLTAFLFQKFYYNAIGMNINYLQVAIITLALAPLSVFGDLFSSIIKRQAKVKDFGSIFPGHGGVIDRFDSLLLVTPILVIVLRFLPLVY